MALNIKLTDEIKAAYNREESTSSLELAKLIGVDHQMLTRRLKRRYDIELERTEITIAKTGHAGRTLKEIKVAMINPQYVKLALMDYCSEIRELLTREKILWN